MKKFNKFDNLKYLCLEGPVSFLDNYIFDISFLKKLNELELIIP